MFFVGDRNPFVMNVVNATSTSRMLSYRFRCRLFSAADRLAALIIRL